jgi:hypothetical protein
VIDVTDAGEVRSGWESMKSAVRWRFSEPEYRAVVATLLSGHEVPDAVATVLDARYVAPPPDDAARLAAAEAVLVEVLGLGVGA